MRIDPNAPAFPTEVEGDQIKHIGRTSWISPGLTIRAEIGAGVLIALLSNGEAHRHSEAEGHTEYIAELALKYTDAFIYQLNKTSEDGK